MVDTFKYFFLNYTTLQEILLHYDKLSERQRKYVITRSNMVKVGNQISIKFLRTLLRVDDFLSAKEIEDLIAMLMRVQV